MQKQIASHYFLVIFKHALTKKALSGTYIQLKDFPIA